MECKDWCFMRPLAGNPMNEAARKQLVERLRAPETKALWQELARHMLSTLTPEKKAAALKRWKIK